MSYFWEQRAGRQNQRPNFNKEENLLCIHEDGSSNPRSPDAKLDMVAGGLEMGDCWELASSLAPGLVRDYLKEIRQRVLDKDVSSSGLHMHSRVQILLCTHNLM